MNIDELRALVTLVEQGQLAVLELKRPNWRVRLEGTAPVAAATNNAAAALPVPASTSAISPVAHDTIRADGFGIFSTRHPARDTALSIDGAQVKSGDVLGLIRLDELYLPVVSDAVGTVKCLVEDGALVGYGTPLFEIAA